MTNLAVVSNAGGCGRTTLVANLASALVERGQKVLAVEFDPANLLGLHLGLASSPTDGWIARLMAGEDWTEAALLNSDGIGFLPFGKLSLEQLDAFEARLRQAPDWLSATLGTLVDQEQTILLLDVPPLPSLYARQAMAAADFILPVLQADGRSLSLLDALKVWLATSGPDKPHAYLVNCLDSSLALEQDLLAVLQQRLAGQLVPYPIHRDESVRLAFARLLSLTEAYPQSQAVHDLAGVAAWLEASLQQGGEQQ